MTAEIKSNPGRGRKEWFMPIIHVNMRAGRSVEDKRKLVTAMTDAVVKSLKVPPEAVRIILNEMLKENYAVAGVLDADKK
jgi:4-oxalocrotonate tautomerase